MNRILLLHGMLADGSGEPLRKGDVAIEGDTIRDVGNFALWEDAERVDCTGLVVAPGFIDAHSHSDLQVLENRSEKLLQGVTSEVVGNCGFSAYPNFKPDALREFGNGILFGSGAWGWRSAAEFLNEVDQRAKLASVASLVGHGSLRIAHAGPRQGALEDSLLDAMEGSLDEALADGATGFSTGLMYAPGSSAPREELERLCRVVRRRNKLYCSHIRDYSNHLLEAIDEQIALAKASECRLQISHLQTVGKVNWEKNALALEKIERAQADGVDVMFDCYPYLAGSTLLSQMLPQWALDGGSASMTQRLKDKAEAKQIAEEICRSMVHEWSDIFISGTGSEKNKDAVGKSLHDLSTDRAKDPMEVVFELLIEENGAVNMLQFNQSESNLRANLTHPQSIIISDGFYVNGKPHPRLHGTFPELLGNICRDRRWLALPEAIHKVTGSPAKRFGMADRGLLRVGLQADIAIFDPNRILSRATYSEPEAQPEGIRRVYRKGKLVLENSVIVH